MSNRLTKLLFMGFFLMAAMFVGSACANDVGPPDIYLECNEEDVIEGCGVEVKCYNQDIDGEFYLWFEGEPFFVYAYFIGYDDDFLLCGSEEVYGNAFFKLEHKCTENQKGRDHEGDIAAEIIIDFTPCFFDP